MVDLEVIQVLQVLQVRVDFPETAHLVPSGPSSPSFGGNSQYGGSSSNPSYNTYPSGSSNGGMGSGTNFIKPPSYGGQASGYGNSTSRSGGWNWFPVKCIWNRFIFKIICYIINI